VKDESGRMDTSEVDTGLIDHWVWHISETLKMDADEYTVADSLRIINGNLNNYPPLFQAVFDRLALDKIITKAQFREYCRRFRPDERHEL